MSAPKHTPGPWEVIVPADDLWSPRVFAGSKFIGLIDNSDDTQDQRIADACLIAAAPDLLAALEAMRDDPSIKAVCNSPLWAQMVNAIARSKVES